MKKLFKKSLAIVLATSFILPNMTVFANEIEITNDYDVVATQESNADSELPVEETFDITPNPEMRLATNKSVIHISTVEDLLNVNNNLDGDYVLANNLDLSGIDWLPIGSAKNPFTGTFNGQGFSIENLNIDFQTSNNDTVGFFSAIRNATVSNLNIKNINISNTRNTSHGTGGLVGTVLGGSLIEKCSVVGGQIEGYREIGGIVGIAHDENSYGKNIISQCYTTVKIIATSYCGGIASTITNTEIKDCFSLSIIECSSYSNGIAGAGITREDPSATIENSYYAGLIYLRATRPLRPPFSGYNGTDTYFDNGLLSIDYDAEGKRTTKQMTELSNYSNWDFSGVWVMDNKMKYPYLGDVNLDLEGSILDPIKISTPEDLKKLAENPTGVFILTNDIDLAFETWTPIPQFEGVLDGNNFKIKNLKLESNSNTTNYLGFFDMLYCAIVRNLHIENIDVNTTVKSPSYTGTIVGNMNRNTLIENCSVIGTSKMQGVYGFGGIAGYMVNDRATISKSFTSIDINGSYVGGIIQSGAMSSQNPSYIIDCYSTSDIQGITYSGGISGSERVPGNIKNFYFAGTLKNNTTIDKFLKDVHPVTSGSESSYFDSDISNLQEPIANAKTTNEMMQKVTFAGWDFVDVWGIEEGRSYPFLRDNNVEHKNDAFTINLSSDQSVYELGDTAEITIAVTGQNITLEGFVDGISTNINNNKLSFEATEEGSYEIKVIATDSQNNKVTKILIIRFINFDEDDFEMPDVEKLLSDTDDDGLSDYEEWLYGTDINNPDTDGDGLSDFEEIVLGTDPLVDDGALDFDGDGLSNLEEFNNGTAIDNPDTDSDGLSDYDEVVRYKTNPLNMDTDGDSVDDELEIKLGTNPLVFDSDTEVSYTYSNPKFKNDSVIPTVELTLPTSKIDSVKISKMEKDDNIIFSSGNLESIGNIFNLESGDDFGIVNVTLQVDSSIVEEYEKQGKTLKAYYFNTETNCLEEVPNQELVKVETRSLGVVLYYIKFAITVQRSINFALFVYEEFMIRKSKADAFKMLTPEAKNGGIVIVQDVSRLMSPQANRTTQANMAKSLITNFLDSQPDVDFSLLSFDELTYWQAGFTNNAPVLSQIVDIVSSLGFSTNPDIPRALKAAIAAFSDNPDIDEIRQIIVITQGKTFTDFEALEYYQARDFANAKGIDINVIQLGDATVPLLKTIAESTDGGYLNLRVYSNEQAISDITTFLYDEIFGDGNDDYHTDTDGDGIPDYYEKLINKNLAGLNKGIFLDELPYADVNKLDWNSADTDGDELLDGEEVELIFLNPLITGNQKYAPSNIYYIKLNSNPLLQDSDYDGIHDKDEIKAKFYMIDDYSKLTFSKDGKEKYNYDLGYKIDYRWFLGDNTEYSNVIAKFSSIIATLAYNQTETNAHDYAISNKPKNYQIERYDRDDTYQLAEFLTLHGFSDVERRNFKKTVDEHVTEFHFGNQMINSFGNKKLIVAVPIRGTFGVLEEWASNFEFGADSDPTSDTDWENKNNHKGFDIVATRINQELKQYVSKISEQYDGSYEVVYWLTGHSRGAAVANLLGQKLEDEGKKTFTYTFATPNTTTSKNISSYKSIFNIVNGEDAVSMLPFDGGVDSEKWGFSRYGTTLVQEKLTDDQKKLFNKRVGENYLASGGIIRNLVLGLSKFAVSKEDIYEYQSKFDVPYSRDENTIYELENQVNAFVSEYAIPYQEFVESGDEIIHRQSPMFAIQYFPDLISKIDSNAFEVLKFVGALTFLSERAVAELVFIVAPYVALTPGTFRDKMNTVAYPHYADTFIIIAETPEYSNYEVNLTDDDIDDFEIDVPSPEEGTLCFAKDTEILCADKRNDDGTFENIHYKKIQDIYDDLIVMPNGRVAKATSIEHESELIYKITLANDTIIKTTEMHSFYINSKGWAPANAIMKGDKLRTYMKNENGSFSLGADISIKNIEFEKDENVYSFQFADKVPYLQYFISESNVLTTTVPGLSRALNDEFIFKKLVDEGLMNEEYVDEGLIDEELIDENLIKEVQLINNAYIELLMDVYTKQSNKEAYTPAAAIVFDKETGKKISIGYNNNNKEWNNRDDSPESHPEEFKTGNPQNSAIAAIKEKADFLNANFKLEWDKHKDAPDIVDEWQGVASFAGSHAEVHAVAEALATIHPGIYPETYYPEDDILIFVINTKGSSLGEPFHTCAHCQFILKDFNIVSDNISGPNEYYWKALEEYDKVQKVQ